MVEKRRVAETYDYATSGIDYTQGTNHHVSGSHYVKCTDDEFPQVDEVTVPQKFTEPLPRAGSDRVPRGGFLYDMQKTAPRPVGCSAVFLSGRQPM